MITLSDIRARDDIKTYIEQADASMEALGFTEHAFAHVGKVSDTAKYILETLGYSDHDIELAQIASYLHDIGNLVNRSEHSQSGAIMAFRILTAMGMPAKDVAIVTTAIGNHDEGTGVAVNPVAAALIIADKTDVRRSRVRNMSYADFDIHDRVNYSVKQSKVLINSDKTEIRLILEIDTKYSSIMDYFEIFLTRMTMCRKAAEKLGLIFKLEINGQQLL